MAKTTKKTDEKVIVVLDSHAIIHRAYHALPDFTTSDGRPTGALYGFITMILAIIDQFKPHMVVAAFDLPKKTFRHELYHEYKGTRKGTDPELKVQLQQARDVCDALSIPIYDAEGFEADDVLGTIAEQTRDDKGLKIIIASGDMDTLQLADKKRVQIFTLKRGIKDTIIYDEKAVRDRFGFEPKLLTDYKGLRGDPSDNIIGVKGIGDKGATTLITHFGTLEKMYAILDKKNGDEKFIEAGIKPRIIGLLRDQRESALFSKTLATIRLDAPVTFSVNPDSWKESLDLEAIRDMCQKHEFRNLWTRFQTILGDTSKDEEVEKEEKVVEVVDETDARLLSIAYWITNSEKTKPKYEDVLLYTGAKNYKEAQDNVMKSLKEQGLENIYEKIEKPLLPTTLKMQENGVLIDKKILSKFSKELHSELDILEKTIFKLSGSEEEFNIRSPKQLSNILFETLELPPKGIKKNASGGYSTKESELEKLADEHEIIAHILKYRELHKLVSTYVDALPELTDENSRLHPELLQDGAATGRFSSKNPNIQNIPIRSERGRLIRHAFIAPQDFKLVAIDYSQIELRIAAVLSGEQYLIDAFNEGQDIHMAVATKMNDCEPSDVTKAMRSAAKAINFGILYGMGVNSLRKNLGTSRADAQIFLNQYFERLPKISEYLETTKAFVNEYGFVQTLFGRRRHLPSINSKAPFIKAMAQRMAINAPIQGTNADLIKLAMVSLDNYIVENKLEDQVKMTMQIHDEVVFEMHNDVYAKVIPEVVAIMQNVMEDSFLNFKVPLPIKVDVEIGDNLGDMEKWEK